MGTAVGIDIETTSLDPTAGHIIEVAAIRFDLDSGREVERFEALCSAPSISPEIIALTGITPAMVAGQPAFAAHRATLKQFIRQDPIFAHNASFDTGWLAHHGLVLANPVWDTFLLASLAWPEEASYNLATLARQQGITVTGEHRAAADIMLTWELLQKMRREALRIPLTLEKTFTSLLTSSEQSHYLPLFRFAEEVLRKSSTKTVVSAEPTPATDPAYYVGEGGIFTQTIPGFTPRLPQTDLAAYLAAALASGTSTVIEAGTGIGKTFAYLVAALTAGGRFLISTHSKVLQDQLVEKDIPLVLTATGLRRRYATLKGRRNYVCGSRLRQSFKTSQPKPEDVWILLKIALWLARGGNGDLERLNLSHVNRGVLARLHADHIICREQCQSTTCPYQQARERASQADILVVNHALLMNLGRLTDSLGPEPFQQLIIDEAHRLEEAAREASKIEFSAEKIAELVHLTQNLTGSERFHHEIDAVQDQFAGLLASAGAILRAATADSRLRLHRGVRQSHSFQKFAEAGHRWVSRIRFAAGLARAQDSSTANREAKVSREVVESLDTLAENWERLLGGGGGTRVQYIEERGRHQTIALIDLPLDIAASAKASLEHIKPTILLSGTMTVDSTFSYIKEVLGIQSWQEKAFPSIFNFSDNMAIFPTQDGPYPGQESHDLFVAQLISKLSQVTKGRLLTLFTSRKSLHEVDKVARNIINKEQVRIFSQGISGGRHNIAKRFRDDHASILFGLASFWEGFDSPGETLSVIVIPKLPFPNVGDPVIEALSEKAGSAAFEKIMLPRMVLRLKQGVGRLLRTVTDRGVVVILDRRLAEKGYGRKVLHSLPPAPIEVLESENIPGRVGEWFGEETIQRWQNLSPGG